MNQSDIFLLVVQAYLGLLRWQSGKESDCQCRYSPWGRKESDTTEQHDFMANSEDMSLIPGPGGYSILTWKIPWTEEPYRPWDCKELDMTEDLNTAQQQNHVLLNVKLNARQQWEHFGKLWNKWRAKNSAFYQDVISEKGK